MSESLNYILQSAVTYHQAGELAEAEELYLQVLKQHPNQPDALNLLGVIAQQEGELEKAISLFGQALAAAPHLAAVHFNRANALRDLGRILDARASYEAALKYNPSYQDALLNLGVLLKEDGQTEAALEQFQALTKLAPGNVKAHCNLAKCYEAAGLLDEAHSTLTTALKLNVDDPDTHFAIANVCAEKKQYDIAINHIKKALILKPNWPEAYNALGMVLNSNKQFDDAIAAHEKAITLTPDNPEYLIALGYTHQNNGDDVNAADLFLRASECETVKTEMFDNFSALAYEKTGPWNALSLLEFSLGLKTSAPTLNNVGVMLQDLGYHALSKPFYEASLKEDPSYSKASAMIGYVHLLSGQFAEGWDALNAEISGDGLHAHRQHEAPFWRGENLENKTIVVFLTVALGEYVLQSSLIEEVTNKCGRCIIECDPRMEPLIKRSFPGVEIISTKGRNKISAALARADYQIPALHIGRHIQLDLNYLKHRTQPTLKPNPTKVEHFRTKYASRANGKPIVGLAWQSNNSHIGKFKSIDLETLAPLLNTDSVSLISLQYGTVSNDLQDQKDRNGIDIYCDPDVDQLRDLDSFFSQVAAMDLVITISNSTAHIAGSMGVPTWVLLPNKGLGPLWFWFLDRTDSPWYPSVRLFRQKAAPSEGHNSWLDVVEEVKTALEKWLTTPLPPRDM